MRSDVPFNVVVHSKTLWTTPSKNQWCDVLMASGPGLVNRHYRPREVVADTISGK